MGRLDALKRRFETARESQPYILVALFFFNCLAFIKRVKVALRAVLAPFLTL